MEIDLTQVGVIAGAVGSAVGAAWVGFSKHYKRQKLRESDVAVALTAQTNIYAQLQRIVKSTSAERALLLKVHNGGKVIDQPATQLYVTIFAEYTPGVMRPVQGNFQKEPLYDHRYLNLVRNVWVKKNVLINTREMDADEMLRGVYEGAGVATSLVSECYAEEGAYWYTSVSWSDEHAVTSAENADIAGAVSAIRGVLRQSLFG